MRRTKENGITLIALIITVIIMLVLAGVSLNALVGDNGIITNAREASTLTKLSTYKEEVEMNLIKYVPEDDLQRKNNISALGENIKKYIPSLKEEDLSDFAVICGELYYLGADDEMKVSAKQVGINILEESSSKEEAIAELETRAMEGIIRQTGNVSSVENTKYGELLKSRKGNSTDWRIITEISKVDGSVNHVYGDDYYYIGKGTTIEDLGALNSGYIVDYEKQKIINIDYSENFSYTYSDIDSVLGVTDKLVFYIDGKNMEADENGNYNWGEGVYLRSDTKSDEDIHPSDYIANNTFTFDGSNFIEISSENTFDFSKGITFECFGSDLSGYKSGNDHEYGAFFSTYSQVFPTDNPKVFCNTRFALRRMSGSGYRFFYSLNTNKSEFDNGYSEYYWSSSGSGLHHNIQLPVDFDFSDNNEIYLTLVVNPKSYDGSSKYICQDLYINGVKSVSSYLDINYWNTFLNTQISMIYVGKMSYGDYLSFVTLKGKIYAIRLYNKALSDDDVWKNYSSSVSYRSY